MVGCTGPPVRAIQERRVGVLVGALLSPTAVPRLRATPWEWSQFSPGWFVLGGGRPQVQPGSPSDEAALRSRAVCGNTIAAALRESRHIFDCVAKRRTCRVWAGANVPLRNGARQVQLAMITGARSGGMSGPSEATRYRRARVACGAPSAAVPWVGSAFAPGGLALTLPCVARAVGANFQLADEDGCCRRGSVASGARQMDRGAPLA